MAGWGLGSGSDRFVDLTSPVVKGSVNSLGGVGFQETSRAVGVTTALQGGPVGEWGGRW